MTTRVSAPGTVIRRPAISVLIAMLLITVGCESGDGGTADTVPNPAAPTTLRAHRTGTSIASTTAVTTATSTVSDSTVSPTTTSSSPPPTLAVPIESFWPEALDEVLLADEGGVTRLNADGVVAVVDPAPAAAAHVDGTGGLLVTRPSIEYKGADMMAIEWIPERPPNRYLWTAFDSLDLMGVMWLPTESRGPRYAAAITHGSDASGPTTCVSLSPVRPLPVVQVNRICRKDANGEITWASWSGRFFVLTLSSRSDGTWLEFADQRGRILGPAHNPAVKGVTRPHIRFTTAVGGSNRLLYIEGEPDGYETLVGIDLDDGAEFLRLALAGPDETIIRLDEFGGVAAVSRAASGAHLPPLLIDLATGEVGSMEVAGVATIPHDGPLEPVLYPPLATSEGPQLMPDIVVTSPEDYARVDDRFITFRGWVRPGMTVSAGPYEADVDPAGGWQIVLGLEPGSNLASISAAVPGSTATLTEEIPVYRVVEGTPDRWLGYMFWTPTEDDRPPFGAEIVDAWPHAGEATTLLAYQLSTAGLLAVAQPEVPITHGPEMLWLVDDLRGGPSARGWVYVTQDVLEIDPPIGYDVRLDEQGRTLVEFDGRTFLVDTEAVRFVELDPNA
ncbi:MAG: hypothetical protein QNJ88_05650 [Acidimicrobiia bacterium]|nr:hypothetical protein [Acidimicrobiia bacterium]